MSVTMKVHVLGTEYQMTVGNEDECPRLVGCDGLCDETTKQMFVESYSKHIREADSKANLPVLSNKVKRHEIIHAFLFESGLAENSAWAQNEEMVDFFAIQAPKLFEAFREANAI